MHVVMGAMQGQDGTTDRDICPELKRSPDRNAWHSHPCTQDDLWLPHLKHLPYWAAQKLILIDIKALGGGRGGGKELLGHAKYTSKRRGAGSKQNKPNQLRSTSKAAVDGKTPLGGSRCEAGHKQTKKHHNYPTLLFPPFFVTVFRA